MGEQYCAEYIICLKHMTTIWFFPVIHLYLLYSITTNLNTVTTVMYSDPPCLEIDNVMHYAGDTNPTICILLSLLQQM